MKYNNVNDDLKGCITLIAVRDRINLEKSISCRGEAHHTHQILKKRLAVEMDKYGKGEGALERTLNWGGLIYGR